MKNKKRHDRKGFQWQLFRSLIVSPLIVGFIGVFGLGWWWAMIPALLLNGIYWYRYNKKYQITNFSNEIKAMIISLIYYLGIFSLIMIVYRYNYVAMSEYPLIAFAFPYNLSSLIAGAFLMYDLFPWLIIGTFWSGVLGAVYYQSVVGQFPKLGKRQMTWLIGLCLISLLPLYQQFAKNLRYVHTYSDTSSELNLKQFRPFMKKSHLASLDHSTNLRFVSHYPRLDGATAAYPIYSAVAQTLYKGMTAKQAAKKVQVGTTPQAFDRLIHKKADVVFMAQPSTKQLAAAKKADVKLKLTQIGSEAFVFFVNKKNPVNSLSVKQIQSIYQRKTIFWSSVGGRFETILPFQRAENSGSQTAMEKLVMRNHQLAKPLKYQEVDGMGGIIDDVAGYNNRTNALGYSFRFYTTKMKRNKNIKLLRVNGIVPNMTTIRHGSYPFIAKIYAISRCHQTKNTQRLIRWIQGRDGQQLIDRSGYVGLR
ncbi:PstS family phosphate ABC transporter substrate-binding protein [Lentilactobacillus hilgardii]|uniref:PstS family phosphate ABC transporter substrate-binding protein n=1 Tax=Lentilactobacillus hilgardii TaxID=1588 RepID=UPI003FA54C32